MKKIVVFLILSFSISSVSALSCTDIPTSLFRYQESPSVLALQNFLFEKGYLKATPNGYFGTGTFNAVKAYQKSEGLAQAGNAGPATRALIKKATCIGGATTTPVIKTSTTTGATPSVTVTKPVVVTPTPTTRNAKRKEDVTTLLKSLYQYFTDSRGVYPTLVIDSPVELCVRPKSLLAEIASTTNTVVVVTTDSPCLTYADISYLSPVYLSSIPRDPKTATTSALTGYTITRSQYNDITIAAKTPEDGAIIKTTCNFNGFCKNPQYITSIIYKQPTLTSINRTILLRDATPKTPLIIYGSNFTATSTVKFFSKYLNKEYTIGTFSATNDTASTSYISIEGSSTNQLFSCGGSCTEKLPLGEYDVTVTTAGGTTNLGHVVMKGFNTSTISTQINSPVVPKTKNVKVATITLSSSIPVTLTSLTLTATSSSANLRSKISNFVMKDTSTGTSYSGGAGAFSFSSVSLGENQSRVYDVYIDTAEVLNQDAGFITYGGTFLLRDPFSQVDLEVPIKEFSFSISY